MNPEQLLERLINNQISREEFDRFMEGLEDEDTLARYEVCLRAYFEKEMEDHFSHCDTESDEEKEETKSSLKVTKGKTTKQKLKSRKNKNLPLAAVLVLTVGLAFSIIFITSQYHAGKASNVVAKTSFTPQILTKSTPRGRKFRMNLDDGSFVHMNAVSTIKYPNKFADDSRKIEIEGEAYFDISRDESRPFNIKVKDYSVEVLGTSFNVQAYKGEDEFTVTVESGTVKINLGEGDNNSCVLEKNQKLIYNPTMNITEIFEVTPEDDISWRKGILRFDSTPMAKVETTIERWYGIDLVIGDSRLYKKTITGTHNNESLKSVIETLTYATGSGYTIKNNSIIIK